MRIFNELEPVATADCSISEAENRVLASLAAVRTIVACGSARGGVGKSALVINIAATLALAGRKIGIVDADLNSPSVAAMLGVKLAHRAFLNDSVEPAAGPLGLRIISSEFLPEVEPPVSFIDLEENSAPQNGS